MALYRAAFLQSDPFALDQVLAPDFAVTLQPADADSLFFESDWDRETERLLADRMLAGLSGVRADSLIQCPLNEVFTLSFGPHPEDPSWRPVGTGPWAGTLARRYQATGTLDAGEFGLDFIQGWARLYVRRDAVPSGGRCCALAYRIVGWEELDPSGAIPKHGTYSWGRVRARWWPDAPPPINACPN